MCFKTVLSSGRSGRVIVTSSLPRTLGTPGPGHKPPAGLTTPAPTFPRWPLRGRRCSSETTLWEALSGSEDTGKHHFTFYNIQYQKFNKNMTGIMQLHTRRPRAGGGLTEQQWTTQPGPQVSLITSGGGRDASGASTPSWGLRRAPGMTTSAGSSPQTPWFVKWQCQTTDSHHFSLFENCNRSLVLLKQKALWIEHMT